MRSSKVTPKAIAVVRKNVGGVGVGRPGDGLFFGRRARGSVFDTTISGNVGDSIVITTPRSVRERNVQRFDNGDSVDRR